ncbi:MAG: M48 family metallopeptidase [Ignavibacteria bacterium]|nr:M48 family metallopeptidase [Ignavibacteria bacterium]
MVIEIKELIFRRRKGFCLRIDKNGDLIVIAPLYATDTDIKSVIQKKANWIIKTREIILQNNQKCRPLNFEPGESIPFLGEYYTISYHNDRNIFVDYERKIFFLPFSDQTTLKRKLMKFYYQKAYELLKEELDKWSNIMGVRYRTLRIKNARRLWGSCGKNASINLNWRLILLPKEIIEHIVIHELSHLVYRNHSKQFKYFASQFSINYAEKEKWLRENSYFLQMFRD